jgi:hypothetical protein
MWQLVHILKVTSRPETARSQDNLKVASREGAKMKP